MARGYFINGATLVSVKGNVNSGIAALSELGLPEDRIEISYEFRHRDIRIDAWGGEIPPDMQFMLAAANISMTLLHHDPDVLAECIKEAMAGASAEGTMPAAGTLMGGGVARFAAGNHYVSLNIYSPVGGRPRRFLTAHLHGNPVSFPLGTEKSAVRINWRAIPYAADPWNGGLGSAGTKIWDYTLDV